MLEKIGFARSAVGAALFLGAAVGFVAHDQTATNPTSPAANVPDSEALPVANCGNWADVSTTDNHAVVYACERGTWLVILSPDGQDFERAWDKQNSVWVTDPGRVPEWSD